jgi:hypothetical protein
MLIVKLHIISLHIWLSLQDPILLKNVSVSIFKLHFNEQKTHPVRLMDTIWTLWFSKRGESCEGHVPILTHFVGSHPLPPIERCESGVQ